MTASFKESDSQPTEAKETEEECRQRQIEANQPLIALLRSWSEESDLEEIEDQHATWEVLNQAFGGESHTVPVGLVVRSARTEDATMATTLDQMDEAQTTDETEEERRQRQIEKNQAAIALLDSWLNETDPEVIREQQETWEYLKRVLDEDRLSYRKLFP